jgi:predicted 3-demethylubiquinone-9 3-methyltransferase (glyoxalase superfamily)/DNA-binding transcriptional ArsR family regulator
MRRDVFQAIADPNRRAILTLLARQRLTLNGVADHFNISRPAISKHIKILSECGLLVIRKQGRERYCEVRPEKLSEVSAWVEQYRQIWEARLDRLDDYLQEVQKEGTVTAQGPQTSQVVLKNQPPFNVKKGDTMSKITPFLWFNDQAEEAMNLYVTLFKNSKVLEVSRYGEGGPGVPGSVMTASFELDGQRVLALNGGPYYTLNESFSFYVDCENQQEVDTLWEKLTAGGGQESMCGWLKDKYGLSWQIIPRALTEMLGDKDPVKAQRVMQAMLQMHKIDTRLLQQAYDGN